MAGLPQDLIEQDCIESENEEYNFRPLSNVSSRQFISNSLDFQAFSWN